MKLRKFFAGAMLALFSGSVLATPVVLDILFDNFPNETSFGIWAEGADTTDIFAGEAYDVGASSPIGFGDGYVLPGDFSGEAPGPWQFVWDLAPGSYSFTIFDTFGDGICCGFGAGEYSLSVNGVQVASGGEFTDFETTNFSVPEPGSLALLGLGLVGFGVARLRRK